MCSFIMNVLEWCAGILASIIVVYISQLINEHCFEPQRKLKELLSQVDFTLNYYANILANPGEANHENEIEASNELRKTAMTFMAYIATNPRIKYKKISHKELDSIGPVLIQLSNSVGKTSDAEKNYQVIDELRKILYKNNPKAL